MIELSDVCSATRAEDGHRCSVQHCPTPSVLVLHRGMRDGFKTRYWLCAGHAWGRYPKAAAAAGIVRPVAEVLRCADWSDGSPPSVDSMLAWLSSQGVCTDIEYLIGHPTPVLVSLHRNGRDPINLPMFATVREACEAAVRAVSPEERHATYRRPG